jgi:hypothetical protein
MDCFKSKLENFIQGEVSTMHERISSQILKILANCCDEVLPVYLNHKSLDVLQDKINKLDIESSLFPAMDGQDTAGENPEARESEEAVTNVTRPYDSNDECDEKGDNLDMFGIPIIDQPGSYPVEDVPNPHTMYANDTGAQESRRTRKPEPTRNSILDNPPERPSLDGEEEDFAMLGGASNILGSELDSFIPSWMEH